MWTLYYLSSKQKDSRFPRCSIQLTDKQTYEPYRKPNNEPVYINIQSNHPSNIIADTPKAISKCLVNISCNKNVFDRNVSIYQATLKNSGFDGKITYNDQSEQANNVNIEEANQARNVNVLLKVQPTSLYDCENEYR